MTNQVVFILAGQPADDAKQLFKEAMKLKKEGEWIILNLGEYSRPYQTSDMELFVKKVNSWKLLTNIAICSILDVCLIWFWMRLWNFTAEIILSKYFACPQ